MPSQVMEQVRHHLAQYCHPIVAASSFSEELRVPTERQVGFWKPESLPPHHMGNWSRILLSQKQHQSLYGACESMYKPNMLMPELTLRPSHTFKKNSSSSSSLIKGATIAMLPAPAPPMSFDLRTKQKYRDYEECSIYVSKLYLK